MRKHPWLCLLALAACVATGPEAFVPYPVASGGDASVRDAGRNAFSLPSANMPLTARLDFSVGNSFFRNPWVIAPASTDARDGLGALYNTNACQNCHIKDGRGHPPEHAGDNAVSMLLRLSIPASSNDAAVITRDGVLADPVYGGQLQDFAVPGVDPEGQLELGWDETAVTLAGGEIVRLRRPTIAVTDLAYGPLHADVQFSARIAPPMIGLGLLEAVPDDTLERLADPDDADGDGISGRVNRVWHLRDGREAIGRFGWKAGQPTLEQQNAAAFNGDLGVSSSLFPHSNCTPAQAACRAQPAGGEPEVSDEILEQVTFYSRNLAVPARRDADDPGVQRGMRVFAETGCSGCHVPRLETGAAADPWLAAQVIAPYTDLLLHDMGEGLADHRREFAASGREWRTPPLWGIGLTATVGGNAYYLHDGRARSLTEAILWHGGEAAPARDAFASLAPADRAALIRFLESL